MPEETTKPFPARAVITLSCCFLVNIYTVTSVFPYLAYYVVEAGAAEDVDAAGYWSGVITAAFMVGRVIGAYPLGRAADRFGRKPVLFLGLATNAALAVAFGSCRSIGAAILTRFLTGLFNGIPIVARTSATELVADAALEADEQQKRRSRAVAWVLGSYSIGVVVGPAIGGVLAGNRALKRGFAVFERYPYLPPNLLTALLGLVLLPCVAAFIPEAPRGRGAAAKPRTAILQNRAAAAAIATYALYSAVEIGVTEVVCLWAVASEASGGLGLSMARVGQALGAVGVFMVVVQFALYEKHVASVGERGGVLGALSRNGPAIAALPVAAYALEAAFGEGGAVAALVLVHGFVKCGDTVFFSALTAVANATVSTEDRGAFQGVNVTLGSLGKALGPTAGAVLFAWTINASALRAADPRVSGVSADVEAAPPPAAASPSHAPLIVEVEGFDADAAPEARESEFTDDEDDGIDADAVPARGAANTRV
ncbi:major facilitator superfamily-like protein [Aureococcus anophagefferens]|nr:major facilitator superfamily-like protein [Aureococcus anophagefferens]